MVGFSLLDGGNQSNAAFVVAELKPFEDRTAPADSAQALIGRVFGEGAAGPHRQHRCLQPAADHRPVDQRRLRVPAARPGGAGSGASWAASMQRAGRRRQPGPAAARASSRPSPPTRRRSISTSTATRRRRSASTSATSSPRCRRRWAAIYVNDFNLFGRTWQVNIQGEAARPRRHRATSSGSRCATSRARWCRCARSPTCASCSGRR